MLQSTKSRTDTPSEDGATEETPTGVDTGKHTSAEERGGEFDPPAVVVEGDDASEAETVERPANVPVEELPKEAAEYLASPNCRQRETHNYWGVSSHDLEHKDDNERGQERNRLLACRNRTGATVMQRANRDSGGRRCRERQLLFHNVVLAKRNDEEDTEEASAER